MRAIFMRERGVKQMSTYKEMYFTLIRAQRDAILKLQEGHQKAEEILLSAEAPDHLRVISLEPEEAPLPSDGCTCKNSLC